MPAFPHHLPGGGFEPRIGAQLLLRQGMLGSPPPSSGHQALYFLPRQRNKASPPPLPDVSRPVFELMKGCTSCWRPLTDATTLVPPSTDGYVPGIADRGCLWSSIPLRPVPSSHRAFRFRNSPVLTVSYGLTTGGLEDRFSFTPIETPRRLPARGLRWHPNPGHDLGVKLSRWSSNLDAEPWKGDVLLPHNIAPTR